MLIRAVVFRLIASLFLAALFIVSPVTARPALAQRDAIDLSQAIVHNSPPDVASWPITSRVERLTMSPEGTRDPGISMFFSARNTWPDWIPPGFEGPLQYTIWAGVRINGVWHVSGFIRMWRDRVATGAPLLTFGPGCTVNNFGCNWAYDGRWGPMAGYQPRAGEAMIFFATAGVARGFTTVTSVRERTNVVMVNLPANDTGTWNFPQTQTDLLIDVGGQGLASLVDAASLAQVHPLNPKTIAAGDLDGTGGDEVVVDFGSQFGIWIKWNSTTWSQLHAATADTIGVGNVDANPREDVIISFPQWGTWAFLNGGTWAQLHHLAVDKMMVIRNGTLVLNFPGSGVWARQSTGTWSQVHPLNPTAFTSGDFDGNGTPDMALAFPGAGVWIRWSQGSWTQINGTDAEQLVTGDLDAVANDDLVIDFGSAGGGTWAMLNTASWAQVHTHSGLHMAIADLDGSGRDDIVIDFGPGQGVWVLGNLQAWTQVTTVPTDAIVPADFN